MDGLWSTKVPLFFQENQGAQNWIDERAKSEPTARKGDGARALLLLSKTKEGQEANVSVVKPKKIT